jgi:hypothetical protein
VSDVDRWAKIEAERKAASRAASDVVLKSHGMTWASYLEFEDSVAALVGDKITVTPDGKVQTYFSDSPVQYKMRRMEKPDEDVFGKRKLRLIPMKPTT